MILGFLTKYRDYLARVHTGPGGDTSTFYTIMSTYYKKWTLLIFQVFRASWCVCRTLDIMSNLLQKSRLFQSLDVLLHNFVNQRSHFPQYQRNSLLVDYLSLGLWHKTLESKSKLPLEVKKGLSSFQLNARCLTG